MIMDYISTVLLNFVHVFIHVLYPDVFMRKHVWIKQSLDKAWRGQTNPKLKQLQHSFLF